MVTPLASSSARARWMSVTRMAAPSLLASPPLTANPMRTPSRSMMTVGTGAALRSTSTRPKRGPYHAAARSMSSTGRARTSLANGYAAS